MARSSGQQVVVVDGVPETAQVLRAVLEPLGHRVERVRGFDPAVSPPSNTVLVLHEDGNSEAARRHKYGTVPRVIIGSLASDCGAAPAGGTEQRLVQPFQYAELIRAVESLLAPDERRVA